MHASRDSFDTFCVLNKSLFQVPPTKEELNTAVDHLAKALEQGKVSKAQSITRALLLTSPDKAISRIRRNGVFRCSRYEYRERSARGVIGDIQRYATTYSLSQVYLDYFRSVDNLLSLGPALQCERASLVKRLRSKQSVVIKTLLANIETFFTYGLHGNGEADTDSIYAYSGEEMAEAFSYLLRLFQACVGLKETHFGMVDDASVENPFYQKLLIDSAKICEFHAAEILIDAFPYSATVEGEVVKVEAIDTLLEKTIRIGYIQAEMQFAIRTDSLHRERHSAQPIAMSVTHFAKEFFDRAGYKLITLAQKPIARYVMGLPTIPQLFEPFSGNKLFLEDLSSLEMLGTEDYVTPNSVIDSPIVGSITVIDVLKIQRFIKFLHQGLFEAFNQHPMDVDRVKIQLQSCIPVFRKDALLQLLQQLLPPTKAEEMLNLITFDPASAEYIDLQYMPIISTQGWYMFSPAVLAGSNLVRNLLCHHSQRLTLRDKTDPMQTSLTEALESAGFLVKAEIKRSIEGNTLEIDILAYRDEHLFIFECKNSYHPCNVYELRTSYSHITHAAEQLEKRKSWLDDQAKQQALFKSLGWNIAPTGKIMTCIAIGNRVVNGYICAGHPVRQVHELLNVLKRGVVVLGGEKYRIWNGVSFSVHDLVAHLAGDTIIADFLNAMQPETRQYRLSSKTLSFATYSLDLCELTKISQSRFPLIESTTPELGGAPI